MFKFKMNTVDPTLNRYLNGDYVAKNPDWDGADAVWKTKKLSELLDTHRIQPNSIVEIGCGSGAVLVALQKKFTHASFVGYDISPDAEQFWSAHQATDIRFKVADYLSEDAEPIDLILLLDVLEHVGNPWQFLNELHGRSSLIAIHFPLDLSAISVLRESPLLNVRNKVGYLHFFTKALALSLLEETGYEVIEARYTNAALDVPQRSLKTKLASWVRKLSYSFSHDFGARLLGGETLMVLARSKSK
jgi:SAM-dependent methyltransferase